MSFKFIKDIDNALDENTNIITNISMICEGNTEKLRTLSESATEVLAKAKDALSKGEGIPEDATNLIAAFRVLANKDRREAIASNEKGGLPSIREKLKLAGKGQQKINDELVNITKTTAPKKFDTMVAELTAAVADEAARKEVIQTIGKMMSVLGQVQTSTDTKPPKGGGEQMASWFK